MPGNGLTEVRAKSLVRVRSALNEGEITHGDITEDLLCANARHMLTPLPQLVHHTYEEVGGDVLETLLVMAINHVLAESFSLGVRSQGDLGRQNYRRPS
jgi:hypothetical protein